jgi:peptidoglycan/LPS O-acetylase OafA/YrhL
LTAAPRHAFGLDLVRALAVASVLVAHGSPFFAEAYYEARYVLIGFGVCGVEIFFALSGFLVGRQLLLVAEGAVDARAFLMRRWYRTLPNYYLFLAVNVAVAVWITHGARPDASYLVFAQTLIEPARVRFFTESWSLAIEEWFYLLAALAFATAAWRRASPASIATMLVAAIIAGPLARYAAQALSGMPLDEGVRKVSLLRLDALCFGVGAAWLERYRPAAFARMARPGWRLAGALLAVAGSAYIARMSDELAFYRAADTPGARWAGSLLFSALPLATALWLPWLSGWRESRSRLAPGVTRLSQWSYALYLTHLPTLLVMLTLWPPVPGDVASMVSRLAVWLAFVLVAAAVVYRYYEHPLTMRRPALSRRARS